MKVEILFKSGAKITVPVTEITTGRNKLTGELQTVQWTSPNRWSRKLYMINVDEIAAMVLIK